jgi:hypothetical protein
MRHTNGDVRHTNGYLGTSPNFNLIEGLGAPLIIIVDLFNSIF